MQEHHYRWLERHPDRDEAWLRQAIDQGFDIHHVDGDHYNNDPNNLVLIERRDHCLIHGFSENFTRSLETPQKKPRQPSKKTLKRGFEAQRMHDEGLPWREIGKALGCSHVAAIKAAETYRKWKDNGGLNRKMPIRA